MDTARSATTTYAESTGSAAPQDRPPLVGVAHMVLRVSDWRTSARWYHDVLGFERRQVQEGVIGFSHEGAPFILLFRPSDEARVSSALPTQRLDHLALHVPSLSALEVWQQQLAQKGIEADIDHATVGSSITLYDPDGLEVELFAPNPGGGLDPLAPGTTPGTRTIPPRV
jgi:glyoxylase I family protein